MSFEEGVGEGIGLSDRLNSLAQELAKFSRRYCHRIQL